MIKPYHTEVATATGLLLTEVSDVREWRGLFGELNRIPPLSNVVNVLSLIHLMHQFRGMVDQSHGCLAWHAHQHFREAIIARYPDRPIIQLPQTIHFQDQGKLKRTASIINTHKNLTLLVRDRRSFDLARSWFTCRVALAPDMAFALGPITRTAKPNAELLLLLRTDCERKSPTFDAAGVVQDWLDEPLDTHRRARNRSIRLLPTLGYRSLDRNARRELRYRNLAEDRVRRGVNQLSSFEYVITDRLHAHILCTLLDLPHTLLDNSYGKVFGFAELWSEDLLLLMTATSIDDAVMEWKRRRTEYEAH